MKSFKEFLIESAKKYEFRIKIAGEVTSEHMDAIESAMDRWGLEEVSPPKRTPIQEHPVDFPMLSNIEVSIIKVVLCYPTTPREIETLLQDCLGIAPDHIRVYTGDSPVEADREEKLQKDEEEYQPLLTTPYPKSDKDLPYGDKFAKNFVKDLEKMPKVKFAGGKTPKAVTTNDLPQGNTSPVGSTKVQKPSPKSFAR